MKWILLFCALKLQALEPAVVPGLSVHDVTPAEAQVYAAFLDQNFKPAKADGPLARGVLVLENESQDIWQKNRRAWETFLTKKVTGPGRASDECLQAFLLRPQQTLRYFDFPATQHSLRLIRSDELRKHLQGGWDAFYDSYPQAQGILSFGALAFGSSSQEALFTVRSQCGRHCGYRDIVYMQKMNGQWLIVLKEALP